MTNTSSEPTESTWASHLFTEPPPDAHHARHRVATQGQLFAADPNAGGADLSDVTRTRALGSRGSRAELDTDEGSYSVAGPVLGVLADVPNWWAARARSAGLGGRWLDVEFALEARSPIPLGPAPEADGRIGADLGDAYLAALPREVRARHGRHYTPSELADELWSMSRRALGAGSTPVRLTGLVRDPGAGAGALLLPPLQEHLRASVHLAPEDVLAELPDLLEGVDADPVAVWVANVALASVCLPLLAAAAPKNRRPLPQLVKEGDGLARADREARVVLMNPPYGRVRLDAIERRRFAHVVYGHANLYGLFMAAGCEALAADGVLAALVPTSFTSGRYFSELRRYLGDLRPMREIVFVENRSGVFADVLQETCLATFVRGGGRGGPLSVASLNGTRSTVGRVPTPSGDRPWLLPRRREDTKLAGAVRRLPLSLGTAGWSVSTGPLVWNRRKADLGPAGSPAAAPVIYGADIDGGVIHRDARRDALRWLALRDALDAKTMVLDEPAILLQRTTAPEQQRRIVAVALSREVLDDWGGRVVVENHVNVLRPARDALLSSRLLMRLLASEVFDRLVRCLSGSVALSAYELEALPLPDAETLAAWERLSQRELSAAMKAVYAAPM